MQKDFYKIIVNPNAGGKKGRNVLSQITSKLDSYYIAYDIDETNYPGQATEFAKEAVKKGYKAIISVGGDGTINEVCKAIINTNVALGIIPVGSGNGLAYHLKIKRDVNKALEYIIANNIKKIDTCTINGTEFINVAGLGFDAQVGYFSKKSKIRGFVNYFYNTLKALFNLNHPLMKIEVDGKHHEGKYFNVAIANGIYYGYDFGIAPLAHLDDGLMDVVLIKKYNLLIYFIITLHLIFKTIHTSKYVTYIKAKDVKLFCEAPKYYQVDGEGYLTEQNYFHFQIYPESLNIFVPDQPL